jgi:putative transposase
MQLKGSSSHAVNKLGSARLGTFRWQAEYGALSFGDNALPRVINYVEHQSDHHASGRLIAKLERYEDDYTLSKSLQPY